MSPRRHVRRGLRRIVIGVATTADLTDEAWWAPRRSRLLRRKQRSRAPPFCCEGEPGRLRACLGYVGRDGRRGWNDETHSTPVRCALAWSSAARS